MLGRRNVQYWERAKRHPIDGTDRVAHGVCDVTASDGEFIGSCAEFGAALSAQIYAADRDRRVAGVLERTGGGESREVGRRPVRTLLTRRRTAATVAGVISGKLIAGDVVDCDGNID